ncbi:MAG: PD-(D/E)XK nuclease family protein, partial [Verrucomicrobia bacterium]|nr:PD-(D/E)XK nuclease family protein [Verrucomicrobiota bacterium]
EEAQDQQSSSDAIELTTSHSAKGLEWEIVVPIGLGRRVYTSQQTGFPKLSHDGVCVIWNSMSQRSVRKEEMGSREEYRRLLYVTLTRARHSLLFPDLPYEDARNSFLEVAGFDLSELPEVQMPLDTLDEITEEHWQEVELPIDVVDFTTAARISHSIPNLVRPHELAKDEEVSDTQLHDEPTSYNYGRWWHDWIERYPWSGSLEIQKNFLRTVNGDLPFFNRAQIEAELFRTSVDIADFAQSVEWFQPEVSFAFPADIATWTEGIIDLVVGTRGGDLWLLDWKTNQRRITEGDRELALRLRETYLAQLEAYRTVIERGFGKNVSRLLIYSTVLGRFV